MTFEQARELAGRQVLGKNKSNNNEIINGVVSNLEPMINDANTPLNNLIDSAKSQVRIVRKELKRKI